jgi:transcriptional regulator with XRE-family HTH domain
MLELGTHQAESVVACMGTVPVSPFGELLKRHRSRLGMSQEVLAERSGMSASAVGALERGSRRAPYRDSVARLAEPSGSRARSVPSSRAQRGEPETVAPKPKQTLR